MERLLDSDYKGSDKNILKIQNLLEEAKRQLLQYFPEIYTGTVGMSADRENEPIEHLEIFESLYLRFYEIVDEIKALILFYRVEEKSSLEALSVLSSAATDFITAMNDRARESTMSLELFSRLPTLRKYLYDIGVAELLFQDTDSTINKQYTYEGNPVLSVRQEEILEAMELVYDGINYYNKFYIKHNPNLGQSYFLQRAKQVLDAYERYLRTSITQISQPKPGLN